MSTDKLDKVTIVIPCYNGEDYISESIQSALDQSYENKEIIVVDDGSTDESKNIIQREFLAKGCKIKYFYKSNGGTSSALNLGIKESTGDWIHWLSADDVLYDNAIQNMMKFIKGFSLSRNVTDYIYYTDYEIIDENGGIKSVFNELDRTDLTSEEMAAEQYHNFYGNGSSTMIARNMFNVVGFFKEGYGYGEDYEFWLRWCLKFGLGFQHIPFVSLMYRVHDKQTTATKKYSENKLKVEELRKQYYPMLNEHQRDYLSKRKDKLTRRIAKHLPNKLVSKLLELKK